MDNNVQIDANLVIEALRGQVRDLSDKLAMAEAYVQQLKREHDQQRDGQDDES